MFYETILEFAYAFTSVFAAFLKHFVLCQHSAKVGIESIKTYQLFGHEQAQNFSSIKKTIFKMKA